MMRQIAKLPQLLLVAIVRFYQLFISPMLGPHCRFQPTCSEYFLRSVQRRGAVVGTWYGMRRILKCHPWCPGGYDPPD